MTNLYKMFKDLLPSAPLLVGEVTLVSPGGHLILLPTGQTISARGVATLGQKVFVMDGVIQGLAPSLTVVEIEV